MHWRVEGETGIMKSTESRRARLVSGAGQPPASNSDLDRPMTELDLRSGSAGAVREGGRRGFNQQSPDLIKKLIILP